jgi:hypothetical protein
MLVSVERSAPETAQRGGGVVGVALELGDVAEQVLLDLEHVPGTKDIGAAA